MCYKELKRDYLDILVSGLNYHRALPYHYQDAGLIAELIAEIKKEKEKEKEKEKGEV